MTQTDIKKLLAQKSGIKLNIACGNTKLEGYVGIDIRPLPTVDIVHDLEEIPWPLPDGCVLEAGARHYIEHIDRRHFGVFRWFNELWRVMKEGGHVILTSPYAFSKGYAQDPTHLNMVNEITYAYFDPDYPLWGIYKPYPWRLHVNNWSPVGNVETVLFKRPAKGECQQGSYEVDKETWKFLEQKYNDKKK